MFSITEEGFQVKGLGIGQRSEQYVYESTRDDRCPRGLSPAITKNENEVNEQASRLKME